MKEIENKTKSMLEIEEKYNVKIEEFLRELYVDLGKSDSAVANILGVSRTTAQNWYKLINISSHQITKTNGELFIPYTTNEEFLQMVKTHDLTIEQIKFGFENGFGSLFAHISISDLEKNHSEEYAKILIEYTKKEIYKYHDKMAEKFLQDNVATINANEFANGYIATTEQYRQHLENSSGIVPQNLIDRLYNLLSEEQEESTTPEDRTNFVSRNIGWE